MEPQGRRLILALHNTKAWRQEILQRSKVSKHTTTNSPQPLEYSYLSTGIPTVNYSSAVSSYSLITDEQSFTNTIQKAYGYNCGAYPPNHDAHLKISRHAADAVREVYGTNYTYGQSCNYLYQTTGYSTDYNYAVGKARYSYLIELRDRGTFGFVLPPVRIMPTVLEMWQGFREILKRI